MSLLFLFLLQTKTQNTEKRRPGLPVSSKVRMKLFTLDSRLIIKKIGGLAAKDQKTVKESLQELIPCKNNNFPGGYW